MPGGTVGLFDVFGTKEEREKGALRKLAQKITQRYGPPENRQKAIEQLADMGTPAALGTLCLRFTIRADIGITDDEEKETVRRLLVEAGKDAVAPVREFLEKQESGISWGLRVLASLLSPAEVLETVVALLDRAGKMYSRDPEKKLVLLSWLTEHHAAPNPTSTATPNAAEGAILPLLEDLSDDVRISAARALARLGAGEGGREALIQLLLRDTDNARVRGDVLQALHDLGADVKGYRPRVEALLAEPFFLDKEGRVKKRG
jgi:hypothetical protein